MVNFICIVLEEVIVVLEKGEVGVVFVLGMVGVMVVLVLFKNGDYLIVLEDLYGGMY